MSCRSFCYCEGSSPGECSILSAGNAAGEYNEKQWDLNVAAEREMSELNLWSSAAIFPQKFVC